MTHVVCDERCYLPVCKQVRGPTIVRSKVLHSSIAHICAVTLCAKVEGQAETGRVCFVHLIVNVYARHGAVLQLPQMCVLLAHRFGVDLALTMY